MNLSNGEKQLILYSQGYFDNVKSKDNFLMDLKTLTAFALGISIDLVEPKNTLELIVNTFLKLRENGYINIEEKYLLIGFSKLDYTRFAHFKYYVDFIKKIDNRYLKLNNYDTLDLGKPKLSLLVNSKKSGIWNLQPASFKNGHVILIGTSSDNFSQMHPSCRTKAYRVLMAQYIGETFKHYKLKSRRDEMMYKAKDYLESRGYTVIIDDSKNL